MANNTSIIVLTPNGRRNTVKCNGNTTILQILEQTCSKHEFNPEEYDLTHHKRIIDASTIMRFSGLPNNALLEMTPIKRMRSESEVTLGLQLESGNRIMGTFNPSTTLLEILRMLVPDQSDIELNPVVIYMRREVYGMTPLKETTLKSLGLTNGRAILRLVHRTPEELKTQANISAPLLSKPKSEDNFNSKSKSLQPLSTNSVVQNIAHNELEKEDSSVDKSPHITVSNKLITHEVKPLPAVEEMEDIIIPIAEVSADPESTLNNAEFEPDFNDEIIVLGERNALVFSQAMASQLPYDDLPDDFYDLTVSEVRSLFKDLVKQREELDDAPLTSAAMKNLEENRRIITQLHDYRKVVLRVLFPDRTVLQGTFGPIDTIQTVMNFVKHYMQNPHEQFDLYFTPPKQILSPTSTLVDVKCVPNALLHFGPRVDETNIEAGMHCQYLKDDILSKLSSPQAASFSACKSRGINSHPVRVTATTSNAVPGTSNSEVGSSHHVVTAGAKTIQPFSVPGPSSSKNSKVPKWFKTT